MLEQERFKEAEQANYHFLLSDLCDYIIKYGWNSVMLDIKDYYDKYTYRIAMGVDKDE